MDRIKLLIMFATFLVSGKSIAQFSLGLDMISRKEFFQYNDPGNLILPDGFSHLSYGVFGKYVFENNLFLESGIYWFSYGRSLNFRPDPGQSFFFETLSNPERFLTIPIRVGYKFDPLSSYSEFINRLNIQPFVGFATSFNSHVGQKGTGPNQTIINERRTNTYFEGGLGLGYRVFRKMEIMFQYGFLKGNHDFVRREVNYIGNSGETVNSTIISNGSARHWGLRFQYDF
jgi:hypothetical protein